MASTIFPPSPLTPKTAMDADGNSRDNNKPRKNTKQDVISPSSAASTTTSTAKSTQSFFKNLLPSKQFTSRRATHLPPSVITPVMTVFDIDQAKYRSPRAVNLDWQDNPESLALALVFERIPFSQQLRLRLVNRQWRYIVEKLCQARRSVKFFGWAPTRNENDELFFSFRTAAAIVEPAKGAIFLTRLLPNICSLGAVCTEKWQAQLLLALLHSKSTWGQQLERLHIRGLPKNKALESKLLTVIFRGLPRLRALSLYGLSAHLVSVQLPSRLSILSQLETFMLEGYTGDLTPIFMQLGPPISHLLLHAEQTKTINMKVRVLETFLKTNPKVGFQLRLLDLAITPDLSCHFWRLICKDFPALETLEVNFLCGITLTETLPYLHLLPKLHKLNFNVDLKKVPFSALTTVFPMPQVKILFLGTIAGPSFDIELLDSIFGRLFPSIEELRFATFSPNVNEFSTSLKRIFPCLRCHQIGLANRGKMEVEVEKKVYRKCW